MNVGEYNSLKHHNQMQEIFKRSEKLTNEKDSIPLDRMLSFCEFIYLDNVL